MKNKLRRDIFVIIFLLLVACIALAVPLAFSNPRWLLAPALLAPKKFRFFAVAAALLFGVTTAVFRIGQGAHFFSDVAFSALVMCLLIVAVYRRLF